MLRQSMKRAAACLLAAAMVLSGMGMDDGMSVEAAEWTITPWEGTESTGDSQRPMDSETAEDTQVAGNSEVTGNSQQQESVSGRFDYQYLADGSVEITKYRAAEKEPVVVVPDKIDGKKVTGIGDYAFYGCDGIVRIELPASVENIGDAYVFSCCDDLIEIVVAEDNANYMSYDGMLYNRVATELLCCPGGKNGAVKVRDGVMTVKMGAFAGCYRLSSVDLPEGVTCIEEKAFSNCIRLDCVDLPSGMKYIEDGAFADCSRLVKIELPKEIVRVGENAFGGCNNIIDVYYDGSREQWAEIEIASGNDFLLNADIHYGDSGVPVHPSGETYVISGGSFSAVQTIDGIYEVTNAVLQIKAGQSCLLADVENVSGEKQPVVMLDIIFYDKSGNEYFTIDGLIGDLTPGGTTQINASVSMELMDAATFRIVVTERVNGGQQDSSQESWSSETETVANSQTISDSETDDSTEHTGLTVNGGGRVYVEPDGHAELAVEAVTDCGTLRYQWYRRIPGTSQLREEQIEGAVNPTYTAENVSENIEYYCRVSNGHTEATIKYYIYVQTYLRAANNYYVTIHPGKSAQFDLYTETNCEPLSYQWYKKNPDTGQKEKLEGETQSSYKETGITQDEVYYCIISDRYESVEITCSVYVRDDILDDSVCKDFETAFYLDCGGRVMVDSGKDAKLTATHENGAMVNYQWYRWNPVNRTMEKVDGATEAAYIVPKVTERVQYCCQVSNLSMSMTVWYMVDVRDEDSTQTPDSEICFHIWDSGKVTTAATCAADGIMTYICTRCGETRTEEIEATEAHTWGEWAVEDEATVFHAEIRVRVCQVCEEEEQEEFGEPLESVMKLTEKSLTMKVKQTGTYSIVYGMADEDYVESVESSNKKIVKVMKYTDDGDIRLKAQNKTGSAKLTITLAGGAEKTITVKVQTGAVRTKKISGVPKKLTIKKGKQVALNPVITPVTSQEKVTYATSKKKVAIVSGKGIITAKAKGTAKITVKSGAKKAVVMVTVK